MNIVQSMGLKKNIMYPNFKQEKYELNDGRNNCSQSKYKMLIEYLAPISTVANTRFNFRYNLYE